MNLIFYFFKKQSIKSNFKFGQLKLIHETFESLITVKNEMILIIDLNKKILNISWQREMPHDK